MAKKLRSAASVAEKFIATTEPTAEELEAKGQTRLIKEEPKQESKEPVKEEVKEKEQKEVIPEPPESQEKKVMGQPKKYDEETKHVSFALPISVVENLKIMAGLRKTNQTQIVLSLIKQELEKDKEKIAAYKKLIE